MSPEDDLKIESLHDQTLPIDKTRGGSCPVQREVTLAFEEAERALQPTYDLPSTFTPIFRKNKLKSRSLPLPTTTAPVVVLAFVWSSKSKMSAYPR